ncbi:MAG: pilus assembly protein N-terminal domain-containing protein [Beijerinckiaceae bacterium]|nr:pilus assembly protein N-terminal domain-containing protein [Beijerinckiaceae bacterium]
MKAVAAAILATLIGSPASAQLAPLDLPTIERGAEPLLLSMTVGQIQVIRTPRSFSEIIIGDTDVADSTVVLSDRTVAITAKKNGLSQFLFVDVEKKVMGSINILVSTREESQKRTIRVFAGHPKVGVGYDKPATYYCAPDTGCEAATANYDRKNPLLADREQRVPVSQASAWSNTQTQQLNGGAAPAASPAP